MSKRWYVEFGLNQKELDYTGVTKRDIIKERVTAVLSQLPVKKDTIKVTNRSIGGGKPKKAGKSFELKIAKSLGMWWWDKPFRRTPNSGGWDKQVNDGKVLASGDIMIPDEAGFPFSVECKHRKDGINWHAKSKGNGSTLIDWWKQCSDDAKRVGKNPLLVFCCNKSEYAAFQDSKAINTISISIDVKVNGTYLFTVVPYGEFLSHYARGTSDVASKPIEAS